MRLTPPAGAKDAAPIGRGHGAGAMGYRAKAGRRLPLRTEEQGILRSRRREFARARVSAGELRGPLPRAPKLKCFGPGRSRTGATLGLPIPYEWLRFPSRILTRTPQYLAHRHVWRCFDAWFRARWTEGGRCPRRSIQSSAYFCFQRTADAAPDLHPTGNPAGDFTLLRVGGAAPNCVHKRIAQGSRGFG